MHLVSYCVCLCFGVFQSKTLFDLKHSLFLFFFFYCVLNFDVSYFHLASVLYLSYCSWLNLQSKRNHVEFNEMKLTWIFALNLAIFFWIWIWIWIFDMISCKTKKRRDFDFVSMILCTGCSSFLFVCLLSFEFGIEDFYMLLCVANIRDTLQNWNASKRAGNRFTEKISIWLPLPLPLQHILMSVGIYVHWLNVDAPWARIYFFSCSALSLSRVALPHLVLHTEKCGWSQRYQSNEIPLEQFHKVETCVPPWWERIKRFKYVPFLLFVCLFLILSSTQSMASRAWRSGTISLQNRK